MRKKSLISSIMVLLMLESPGALSGDSTSLAARNSVGYSRPSANQASVAEQADRASHADTADRLLGEEDGDAPEAAPAGVICSPSTRACADRMQLPPGTYIVHCLSHPEDGNAYQVTVVLTGKTGGANYDWVRCPHGGMGRLGIHGYDLVWIHRV